MSVLGLELTPGELRAVRLTRPGGHVVRTFRAPWDPSHPQAGVSELRRTVGRIDRLAVSVGVGFLDLKHVTLPPAPPAERERMLALEPDRFFAGLSEAGDTVTALDTASDMAFALPAGTLADWLAALGDWAPVDRIEAAPVSVARVVDAAGTFLLDAASDETAVVEVRDHVLLLARRLPVHVDRNGARPLPSGRPVDPPFHAALGVARAVDAPLAGLLAPPDVRAAIAGRRRRAVWLAAALAVLAVGLAGWSFERYQERQLDALARTLGTLRANAGPALTARDQLASLGSELAVIRQIRTEGARPLATLAALSEALPGDVVLTSARLQGTHWQIEGTARDAAALVPLLSRLANVDSVRSLAATSRFTDAGRVRESFSLAFTVHHAP